MKKILLACALSSFALTACNDDKGNEIIEPTPVATAGVDSGNSIAIFPSDIYSVEDATSFTGRRVHYDPSAYDYTAKWSKIRKSFASQLNGLDGFGTSAGAWVRFNEAIDISAPETVINKVQMGFLDGANVTLLPIEVPLYKQQVSIRPHYPIPPNTEAFFYIEKGLTTEEGTDFERTKELQDILAGKTPEGFPADIAQRMRDTAQALLDADKIASTDDLLVLSVFTTQSIHETDQEVASLIQARDPEVDVDGPCEDHSSNLYRICSFTFTVPNFIEQDGTIADDAADHPSDPYRMRAYAFLPPVNDDNVYAIPLDEEKGFATAIFGHGLTGAGDEGGQIARFTAGDGLVTISIDAPQHGSHPLRTAGTGELDIILDLFGISAVNADIHGRRLRDGWRHSNFDKLALVEALQTGIDFDGDGNFEIDTDRLTYLGGSLGGIQGSEFLALSDDFVAGLYAVPGARMTDIVRYGAIFKAVTSLLFFGEPADHVMQFIITLQTIVEKGDGINWAPYIMQNRFSGNDDAIPHIAMQISVPDEVVPAESGMALARVLGVDAIGAMPLQDPLVHSLGSSVKGNHPSGRTAGLLQTDWIRSSPDAEYKPSEHAKSADSVEGIAYWTHAFRTLFTGDGVMELVDPYQLPDAPIRPGY